MWKIIISLYLVCLAELSASEKQMVEEQQNMEIFLVESSEIRKEEMEEETERIFDAYEIEEKVYILEEDHIDIEIYYPQLHGFTDHKREEMSIY